MNQFEIKIEFQSLFTVSVIDNTDSTTEPYSLEIKTDNTIMFTVILEL